MVQPYYLVDPTRRSTAIELETMALIRQQLSIKNAPAAARMLPLIVIERATYRQMDEFRRAYVELLKVGHLGSQYEWLARFASEHGIDKLELSIEKLSAPHRLLMQDLEPFSDVNGYNYRLTDDPSHPSLLLFRNFNFPLLNTSKSDMQAYAMRHGFLDLMDHTWFCFSPIGGQPCGTCSPCRQVIDSGLTRRIPLLGRVRYHVFKPYFLIKKRMFRIRQKGES